MTLCKSKNNISQIVGTSFAPEKIKSTLFSVIATKPVDIVSEKMIDNIK